MKAQKVLGGINHLVNALIILIFVPMLLFGGYALYDNVAATQNVTRLNSYKPDNALSFAKLTKINADVFGWITIDDTTIDQPLVQGKDNSHYVNTNVLGEFSLGGSIFLDYRNNIHLSDTNNIIYGHNIEDRKMFGAIKNYEDQDFFNHHLKGRIYYAGKWHSLEILAYLHTNAYNTKLYNPHSEQSQMNKIIAQATYQNNKTLHKHEHFVTLSTCTNADTDGRYVLIARIGGLNS